MAAELVNLRTSGDFWVTVALVKPTQQFPSISCAGAAELGNTRDDPRLQSISMSQVAVASVLKHIEAKKQKLCRQSDETAILVF